MKLGLIKCQCQLHEQNNSTLLGEKNEFKKNISDVPGIIKDDVRDLKYKNKKLKSDLDDLEFVYNHTLEKLRELERESFEKNNKILQLTKNESNNSNSDEKTTHRANFEVSKTIKERVNFEDRLWKSKAHAKDVRVVNIVQIMEKKCASLMEELRNLKLETKRQTNVISTLQRQIAHKDGEIERLRKTLEKDESSPPPDDNYCCHCRQLKCKIEKLEMQLTETIEKQHEAMTRAVQLAEKNRNLERELKDIDEMAMAVEEECQSKVKQNARNVVILQEEIGEKIDQIKSLQSEVVDLRIRLDKEKLTVEKLNWEKKSLEKSLEDAINEKKCLNDKINHYVLIERNLRIEIAKLQELNKSLQRQVYEMDGKLGEPLGRSMKGKEKSKPKKKNPALGLPTSSNLITNHCRLTSQKPAAKGDSKTDGPLESDFDCNNFGRDRIQNNCHCLCSRERHEIEESDCCRNHSGLCENFHRKLTDMEKEIEMLKQENFCLKREKALRSKLDNDYPHCTSGDSFKIMLDRLERERDLALSDVSKLTTERDILKERIKLSTESQIGENSRMERILLENEERIRRLESERRELISSQGSQRATLSALEEKCDDYKNQVFNLENELSRITTHYNQLKVLHEETDRSLSEVHGRLSHTQTELNLTLNKLKELENVNQSLEEQIIVLKKEKSTLKASLACNEREKDDLLLSLDEKTELCSKQQSELKNKDKYIAELNEKISDLQKKLEFILNEKTTREHVVLNLERDTQHLREALEKCENEKEAFKRENRRLQDDLTSAVKDCHLARRQLDNEKKEVENLKRQLQQYVNEVKRAEELLFQKESERNEMLDHFRSLSIEATALESNNHTLESAMETTKVELLAANNRLMNLEQEVSAKESLVNSYENQIADLTARVAELEGKLKQENQEKYRIEEDLAALRNLCSTIDEQKENLRRQASDSDAEKLHLINEVQRLNEEYEGLNHKLVHERTLAQTLEKSLSHSRQETLEHKISNKDLQSQLQQMKIKIDELTQKLESESQNVQKYQSQCAELSCQVSELRREVTNARYEKARALDAYRRCRCSVKVPSDDEESLESPFSLPHSARTYTRSPPLFRARPQDILVSDCYGKSSEVECHGIQESPFRDIPPLIFLEDSDRTVSDEEEMPLSFRPRITFLSPVLEKSDKSKWFDCEGTSSDLSSLPEDCFSRITIFPKENDTACDLDYSNLPRSEIHKRIHECAGHTDGRCLGNSFSLCKHCTRVFPVEVRDKAKQDFEITGTSGFKKNFQSADYTTSPFTEHEFKLDEGEEIGKYVSVPRGISQSFTNDGGFVRRYTNFLPYSRGEKSDCNPNGMIRLNGESVTDSFSRYHEDVDETTYSIVDENGSII